MKTIKLDCFNIIIELGDHGFGTITSDLPEICSYCNSADCDMTCPDALEYISDRDPEEFRLKSEQALNFRVYNSAMHAIESLILAHACAGIDVTTPAYVEGIESAFDGCSNN